MSDCDLIIIGAGPAGMAAAAHAAQGGLKVLVVDEQPRAGGQIYRNASANADRRPWLGKDYRAGVTLIEGLNSGRISTEFGATIWRIDPGHRLYWSRDDKSHISTAPYVLLATGAQERPMPFPGWTLPGVMPAGAAQILMKTAGLLPRDAVLAGSGPLLYLIAAQMIAAGTPPKALVETQTRTDMINAARYLPKALLAPGILFKGLGLLQQIRKAGVRRYTGATAFHAASDNNGDVIFSFRSHGRNHVLNCSLLLTHLGVIPATHLSRAAGISHIWDKAQFCFRPVTERCGQTNIPGLFVAGDGAGIHGAGAAVASGQLAALEILHDCGKLSREARTQQAKAAATTHRRARAIRSFLDAAYAPPKEFQSPPGETIVCRCEEVTAAEIRLSVHEGAAGHRQIKTATRAGMGPCQGRLCDLTVRGVLHDCPLAPAHDLAPPRARAPVKPITLGELAALTGET